MFMEATFLLLHVIYFKRSMISIRANIEIYPVPWARFYCKLFLVLDIYAKISSHVSVYHLFLHVEGLLRK